jgi:predicted ATPase
MFQKDGNCQAEIDILKRLNLLYWKIADVCFENKWFTREDLIYFSFACLECNIADTDYRVSLIAYGDHYKNDIDLQEIVSKIASNESINDQTAEEIWILARLIAVKESKESDEIRFNELQDIIMSAREYPEILYNCDQYHITNIKPFDAMDNAIKSLSSKLFVL